MEAELISLAERAAKAEQDLKSVHHRLDNLENLTESVHIIAVETKEIHRNVNGLSDRMTELEKRPVKRYETLIMAVLTALIGAAAGYFFR